MAEQKWTLAWIGGPSTWASSNRSLPAPRRRGAGSGGLGDGLAWCPYSGVKLGDDSMAGNTAVQICSTAGCGAPAGFTTRTKPAWCTKCIDTIFQAGGLVPLEPFTNPRAYRRTECLTCGSQMPYRFAYVLEIR